MDKYEICGRSPRHIKKKRVIKALIILLIILIALLVIGYVGYHYIFKLNRSDAVFNAGLTVSNLAIGLHEKTTAEKIFTALYSLVSGLFFVAFVSAVIAYVFSLYFED